MNGLYKVDIDQALAKDLLKSGGFLLVLDVPEGIIVGMDQQSCIVGPKFQGFKMIPPGSHILHYNSISKEREVSATVSQFLHFSPQQIVIRRWDAESELLMPLQDLDEESRYAKGIARLDFESGLAPYNLNAYPAWKSLSRHIDAKTVDRLSPVAGNLCVTAEAAPLGGAGSEAERDLAAQLSNVEITQPGSSRSGTGTGSPTSGGQRHETVGRCFYARIPKTLKGVGMSAEELTRHHLDKSLILERLIQKEYGGDPSALLGEFQFAFAAFLCGQSLESYAQWKQMLELLLTCESYPLTTASGSKFYSLLLEAIEAQVANSMDCVQPKAERSGQGNDLVSLEMLDDLLSGSFLKQLFAQFFEILQDTDKPLHPSLKEASSKLERTLQERLGWSFQLEDLEEEELDDEYRPVVVSL